MNGESIFMLKQAKVDLYLGWATIVWVIGCYILNSRLMDDLTVYAPKYIWLIGGIIVGVCQVALAKNPLRFIGSRFHFPIALAGALFWVYIAYTAIQVGVNPLTVTVYCLAAAASLWDLAHA